MNYMTTAPQPFLALVDDDLHSSRLMTRMLLAHGAPSVEALEGSRAAAAKLGPLLADPHAQLPGLVLVDLKETADATRDFIAGLVKLPRGGELVVAAMAPSLERETRDGLLQAGATAVFQRHADMDAYRREAAAIVSFWVRHQRLNAIGT
jgi:CheY-like chemotaxis protein